MNNERSGGYRHLMAEKKDRYTQADLSPTEDGIRAGARQGH
jgi:hypothetical protein